jgi:hypothetical protein
MKKTMYLFTVALFWIQISVKAQKNAEETAIKDVIEQETNAVIIADYSKWLNAWSHDSLCYVVRSGNEYCNTLNGWDNIDKAYKDYMQNTAFNSAVFSEDARRYDYQFRINGTVSIVSFKEGDGILEVFVLQKNNSAWKIAGITTIDLPSYKHISPVEIFRPDDPGEFDTSNYRYYK